MSRRFTLFALTIAMISGALKLASAQPKEVPLSGEKALVVYAPRPRYPGVSTAVGMKRSTGSGIALLEVDSRTGNVTSARMLQSTGDKTLDEAALDAFRQWRFKPGTVSRVRMPITFTLRGVR